MGWGVKAENNQIVSIKFQIDTYIGIDIIDC